MAQISQRQEENVPKIIVGNKCDFRSRDRCVSYEEGKELAKKHGASFVEASAKEGLNVDTIFQTLGELVLDKLQKESQSQ